MQRKSLGENEGMLFIYNQPRTMSFWMRNTHIPLDIGYFSTSIWARNNISLTCDTGSSKVKINRIIEF